MTICLVCQGSHLNAVDDALMAGVSVRQVASRFDLSKSGVARHRTGCLQPKLVAAARITAPAAEVRSAVDRAKAIISGELPANHADILGLAGLLGRLGRSLERLEGAAVSAADKDLYVPLAAVSGQLHRGIESAAKIQGMYAEPQLGGEGGLRITFNLPAAHHESAASPRNITPGAADPANVAPSPLVIRFH